MKETYRFLLYNIRYGTGTGWRFHAPVPFSGYLRKTRKNIPGIIEFIKSQNPDLVGLIEVDGGSSRASGVSQAEQIADGLGHHSVFMTKYKKRVKPGRIPIISRQGNAFLASGPIHAAHVGMFMPGRWAFSRPVDGPSHACPFGKAMSRGGADSRPASRPIHAPQVG